jgi:hypothetical protein
MGTGQQEDGGATAGEEPAWKKLAREKIGEKRKSFKEVLERRTGATAKEPEIHKSDE